MDVDRGLAGLASDSGENGLSGLSGSAAFLKNCEANSWYGAAMSIQLVSTPASRFCRSVSLSRMGRTAAWWAAPIRS